MSFPVDPSRFFAFVGIMAVLAVTPGPANVFQMALGAQRGARAAMLSMAGMNLATLTWFTVAALGLGVVAERLPGLFQLLTFVGVAYLIGLAAQALAKAVRAEDPSRELKPAARPGAHALRQGFLVQIANPKIMLFFGAIVPPFLDLHRPLVPQLLVFAAVTVSFDVITNFSSSFR